MATVKDGAITIKKYGETTITAYADGKDASCKLTVYAELFGNQWDCEDTYNDFPWIEYFVKTGDGKGIYYQLVVEDEEATDSYRIDFDYTCPSAGVFDMILDADQGSTYTFTSPDTFVAKDKNSNYCWTGKLAKKQYPFSERK